MDPPLTFAERVAIDRGLRLADKRSLPCPRRMEWLAARDSLYEEIMEKAYNKELGFFGQSYEDKDVLDSSLCIMPLVFFSTPVSLRRVNFLRCDALISCTCRLIRGS